MNSSPVAARLNTLLGTPPRRLQPLTGGMIGEVYRVDLADGRTLVAKVAQSTAAHLSIEGYMLRYLREHSRLPVPEVLHAEDTLLLMTYVEGKSHLGPSEQAHAADLLADLHGITQTGFGLERDTLIGPLPQPNPLTASWIDFFRDQRLRSMAQIAHEQGPLPGSLRSRIDRLSARLENWLLEPDQPSLIHGDLWTTNVLTRNGRVVGFIDPAIYYGHAEIELAYMRLFHSFGAPFFDRYQQLRPLEPGFFEERSDLYNLYPLLVHVRLFGGSYIQMVDAALRRFGF